MSTTRHFWFRGMPLALSLGLALIGAGLSSSAQEPKSTEAAQTRTISVGDLTLEVPSTWKSLRPTSAMRQAELEIPAAEGDSKPGNLSVFVFPGGAGTVDANVQRWQAQFKDAAGQTPKVESAKVKGANVDVRRVEVAGTYVEPPFAGGGTFPGYRLLGAIVEAPQAAYFFKLVGPDQTIQQAEAGFDAMIATIRRAE